MPRFVNAASSPDERIYGTGGNWTGILEPYKYPLTVEFFKGLQYWMQKDKVFERAAKSVKVPKRGPKRRCLSMSSYEFMRPDACKQSMSKGISIPERLDLDARSQVERLFSEPHEAPNVKVGDASREVAKSLGGDF